MTRSGARRQRSEGGAWCAERVEPSSSQDRTVSSAGHVRAWNAACGRAVAALHCCRLSGVASHESQSQSRSQGLSSRAAEGAPRLIQAVGHATDVQMADVQCDQQPPNERVAHQAALQVVPTTPLAMSTAPMEVETAQAMQIDMATPRAGRATGQCRSPKSHCSGQLV